MGQYHAIVNFDRRTGFDPHSVDSGIKLMELGHTPRSLAGLFVLLTDEWAGDKIAIVGDYAEKGDLPFKVKAATGIATEDIFSVVTSNKDYKAAGHDAHGWLPCGWLARKTMEESGFGTFHSEDRSWDSGKDWRFTENPNPTPMGEHVFVNHTTREYVDPAGLGDSRELSDWALNGHDGGMTTATAVLLGVSSRNGGRGGGDFYYDSPLVGSWGGNSLAVVSIEDTDGYTDITPTVRDVLAIGGEGEYILNTNGVTRKKWTEEIVLRSEKVA